MAEVRRLTTGKTIEYSGPFDLGGLRGQIDTWFDDRFDYDADKVMDEEQVFQDHKQLKVVWDAKKDMSDYAMIKMEVTLLIDDLTDIRIESEQGDIAAKDGDVTFMIDAWVHTDTEGRYEQRPVLYFLRYVAEHMFYKNYIDEYEDRLHEHINDLQREVRRYLNKDIQV